jgi:hypothetical protein
MRRKNMRRISGVGVVLLLLTALVGSQFVPLTNAHMDNSPYAGMEAVVAVSGANGFITPQCMYKDCTDQPFGYCIPVEYEWECFDLGGGQCSAGACIK